jgi:ABC-type Na+ efflux pump permease subunit
MNLGKILRIAKWEVEHQYTNLTPKRVLIFALVTILTFSLFTFAGTNAELQDRLYSVGVSSDSPYIEVVEDAPELDANIIDVGSDELDKEKVRNGKYELLIKDGNIIKQSDSSSSDVALSILKQSIIDSNQEILLGEGYENIAFPVLANLTYSEQPNVNALLTESEQNNLDENRLDGDNMRGDDTTEDDTTKDDTTESDTTKDDTTKDDESSEEESPENTDSDSESENTSDDSNFNVIETENDESEFTTPSDIQPPFPLESIVFGFIFLVPMNFIVQTYASSFFDERIDYSGELLLVTPMTRFDIIIGKTIPYLAAIIGIATVLSIVLGASILSVVAVGVIGIAFLSAGFVTGIFARSYKELTFVFLTLSLALFGFVLVPAVFTTIHPISIISPLTVVISQLESEALTIGDIIFSTVPLTLSGVLLFLYGSGIYKEEDLFTERRVPRKFLDALSNWISSPRSLLVIGATVIPFVFASQLLLIALLFALPQAIALPVMLILAAIIEEFSKSIPVYAGVIDDKLSGQKEKYLAAIFSGIGFFVAEQITTIVQLVGLLQIEIGSAVFSGTLSSVTTATPLGFLLPVMWIAIHPLSTVVSSIGSGKGKYVYIITLILGSAVHILYNFTVILNA